MSILTLQDAKDHLRYDDDAADTMLLGYVAAAESAILRYITDDFEGGIYPAEVKQAALLLVGFFDDQRNAESVPNGNYLPFAVQSLLYPYRNPTVI